MPLETDGFDSIEEHFTCLDNIHVTNKMLFFLKDIISSNYCSVEIGSKRPYLLLVTFSVLHFSSIEAKSSKCCRVIVLFPCRMDVYSGDALCVSF